MYQDKDCLIFLCDSYSVYYIYIYTKTFCVCECVLVFGYLISIFTNFKLNFIYHMFIFESFIFFLLSVSFALYMILCYMIQD